MESEPDSDRSPVFEKRLANISLTDETRAERGVKSEEDETASREKFMALVQKARKLAERGDIVRALQLNKEALGIHHSEKLEKRIQKMEEFLSQLDDSDDEESKEDMEDLGLGFKLHCSMAGKLYTHQKEGVLWLWSLYRKGKGGILADDMGLGKTIQMIAFLAGMFDMDKIKTVMIVVPLSVMPTWESEFAKWTPGITITQFHGSSKKERERALHKVRSRGGVVLTTYGLIVTQNETLSERFGREFVWDYIILDEGHKIKNKTKTSTGMNAIPAKNRIILTGTPVQNNLKELWSLFDYVHQGSLLGTVRTFKMQFETPITRARERDASAVDKRLGLEMSDALKKIIQPYFLRRTKKDVAQQGEETQDERCAKMPELTRKNDIVLWVHLNEIQQKIYKDFLDLDEVKALLNTKKSPLVALTVLKKICDHPRLLPTRACMKLGLDGKEYDEDDLEQENSNEVLANQIDNIPDDVLVGEAGKMGILIGLLDNFKMEGHKTLVFSQSRKLLDMIQRVITNRGHKVARLDGTITSLEERKDIVNKFQKNPNYSVFLLTIQVGGVGLTITAADRVIIYDPSWNPAVDAQAVDRAYRIGQTENVVVHRLISCGTVEEKIYRRQVFKDSITKQTTSDTKNPYRYFTHMELKELFTLDDPRFSKTQQQLQDMHANQRVTDESLDMHIAFLHSLDIFGISDHDLMFSDTQSRDDEEGDDNMFIGKPELDNNEQFIQYKIQRAQMMIAEESNNVLTYEQRTSGAVRSIANNTGTEPEPRIQPYSSLFTQVMPTPMDSEVINLSGDDNDEDADENRSGEEQQKNHEEYPTPTIEAIHIEDSDEEEDIKPNIKHENVEVDIEPVVKQEHDTVQNGLYQEVNDNLDRDVKPIINHEPENTCHDSSIQIIDSEDEDTVGNSAADADNIGHQDISDDNAGDSSFEMFDEDGCDSGNSVLAKPKNRDYDDDDELIDDPSGECDIKKKGPVSLSVFHSEESRSALHKRALQPLTQEDVDQRSPVVMRDGRRIVSEEIIISPDCNQPLIGLEASSKNYERKSSTTPLRPSSCRKLQLSMSGNSPQNVNASASLISSPEICSPYAKSRVNLHKTFFQSSPTSPQKTGSQSVSGLVNVLAADSPNSSALRQLLSVENSPNLSFDTPSAQRSLSFDMDASQEVIQKTSKHIRRIIDESDNEEEGDGNEENDENSVTVEEPEDDEGKHEEAQENEEEDSEEEEIDENNERFQELIMVARQLYKKKDYEESLQYVEEALKIIKEPDLEVMADKIRRKLGYQQE